MMILIAMFGAISLFSPGLALCSIVGEVANLADAWFRMSNFELLTAVSLWTASFYGTAKIRMGTKLHPALAKSLSFSIYCVNFTCLALVVLHFAPETEAVFDFFIDLTRRIFG